MWSALHSEAAAQWSSDTGNINEQSLGTVVHAQRAFSAHVAYQRYDSLLASFDAFSAAGKHASARLLSVSCTTKVLELKGS
jgi:hypothetical protein